MKKILIAAVIASSLSCSSFGGDKIELLGHEMDICDKKICVKGEWACAVDLDLFICMSSRTSKKMKDGTVRYWMLTIPKKGEKIEGSDKGRSLKRSIRVRCDEDSMAIEAMYLYDGYFGEGKIIDHYLPRNPQYEPLIPGSIGERLGKMACRLAK